MVKENHTLDDYFGAFPGAIGTTTGKVKTSSGVKTIPLNPLVDNPLFYCHKFSCAAVDYDHGAMDAFNKGDLEHCAAPPFTCYQLASRSQIPNYWRLAERYVLGDNGFTSERGPSFPNHLLSVAAGSGSGVQRPGNR